MADAHCTALLSVKITERIRIKVKLMADVHCTTKLLV